MTETRVFKSNDIIKITNISTNNIRTIYNPKIIESNLHWSEIKTNEYRAHSWALSAIELVKNIEPIVNNNYEIY